MAVQCQMRSAKLQQLIDKLTISFFPFICFCIPRPILRCVWQQTSSQKRIVCVQKFGGDYLANRFEDI